MNDRDRPSPVPPVQQAWPSPARAWYAVAVFALALMCNFLDRQILTLLVVPIKRDLDLTDTQVSILIGFAFVSFYVLMGIPIARLVDSRSRRLIMGAGIATWSAMTALCGLAQNYWQLFIARMGVGVGEACNGPATYSMLSDLFPREKLPKAIAVLNFGFMFGTGLALIIGGTVVQMVSGMPDLELPVIGRIHAWQLTFIIVGLPGLLVAALMATVREPVRRGLISGPQAGRKSLPIRMVVEFMRGDWKTYAPIFVGTGLKSLLSFGVSVWVPTLFVRNFGWSIGEIGLAQGLIALTVSPVALLLGGLLAEKLAKKGHDDANLRVVLLASIVVVPCAVLFPLMPNAHLALGLFALNSFAASLGPGPQNAAIQVITPNEMRGQVTALYLAVFNLIGYGLGPTFVAVLTDYVFGSEARLPYSLSLAAAILGPIAVLVVWSGLKPYGQSVARSRAWMG